MRNLVSSLLIAAAVGAAPAVQAQSAQGVVATGPGVAAAAKTVDITATITAIDKATRAVTLKGPQGNQKTITAGPEVKNFDQLKVGDQVDIQYVESLVLELKKGSTAAPSITEKAGGARAQPGTAPGGVVGRQITIVGEVLETNAANQTVVVRGPKQTVEMKVQDAEQFKRIAKGDRIEATYTEAVAAIVKPRAK